MLLFIALPLIAALSIGLDYLRRTLLPPAPSTSGVGNPYTPPFIGGQCVGISYRLRIRYLDTDGWHVDQAAAQVGAIKSLVYTGYIGTIHYWQSTSGNNTVRSHSFPSFNPAVPTKLEWFRSDGIPDTCGDIPDPAPPPSPSSDGVATSAPPDITDDDLVIEGAPIVPYNPLTAALAALLAALKAASDLKDAIDFIGDMLDKIGKGIDEVKDWLDDKNKNPDSGKDIKRHDYGSIRRDGFLRLFPSGEQNGFTPEYLDLQLLSIPVGYGKYFGSLSPNFYRFKSLGYISFVSPSFGNLETVEIEFSRCSINIPPNAYGFFYHLGLENVIRANVSLFYSIDKVEEE